MPFNVSGFFAILIVQYESEDPGLSGVQIREPSLLACSEEHARQLGAKRDLSPTKPLATSVSSFAGRFCSACNVRKTPPFSRCFFFAFVFVHGRWPAACKHLRACELTWQRWLGTRASGHLESQQAKATSFNLQQPAKGKLACHSG